MLRKGRVSLVNEILINQMMLNGVSITELAKKLDITNEEMVSKLNAEMTIMERFEVLSAIFDIIKERDIP